MPMSRIMKALPAYFGGKRRLLGTIFHDLPPAAEVPIFVVSTFDTDYLLVRSVDLERARRVLEDAGHRIVVR